MTKQSVLQKQRERFLLERFLECSGLQAKNIEEREAPDFLVCFDGKEVGIELTRLFLSHTIHAKQIQESISDKIVSRAQQLYQECSAPPAHVSICFSPSANLGNLNRDRAAEMISAFVRNLNLVQGQLVNCRSEECENLQFPEEILFVHALGVPSYKMAHWTTARAGWVAPITIQVLQARIEEKSKKLKEYQKVVAENWLVIIADGTKPSQLFSVPLDFNKELISSPFFRTFYYGYPDRTLIELGK